MPTNTEPEGSAPTLLGMPNSNVQPGKRTNKGFLSGGTAGEAAFRDGVILVLVAWGLLFALAWSLRRHNV